METHCPHCDTRYDVDDDVLAVCGGEVRCYHCERVFNVLEVEAGYQIDRNESSIQRAIHTAIDTDRPVIALRHAPDAAPDQAPDDLQPTAPQVFAEKQSTPDVDADPTLEAAPVFDIAEPSAAGAHSKLPKVLGSLLIIALTVGALAQWGWLERDRLLAQPWLSVLVTELGDRFDLPIPNVRADPKQFTILRHQLSPDERHAGALLLRAIARNDSRHAQPPPALQLTLFDSVQVIVARRTFGPTEYLSESFADQLISPQQVFTLQLVLEDPGDRASGFELGFF